MQDHSSKLKRPRDVNQLAKLVVDLATGEPGLESSPVADMDGQQDTPSESLRQAAAELGRRGGLKGGKARAAKLTPEQRAEIAKRAAKARWSKS